MTEEASHPAQKYQPGRPHSHADMSEILRRRERAVELKARGWSIADIARENETSWSTAYTDIHTYLDHLGLYYNARSFREQIAATLRADMKAADDILESLKESKEPWAYEARIKAISARTRAANACARVYGFIGERSFYLAGIAGQTPGEGLMTPGSDWTKGLEPEKVMELREKVLEVYRARHAPAAVPAEYTIDEEPAPEDTPPPTTNGHAPNGDDGPVTMSEG